MAKKATGGGNSKIGRNKLKSEIYSRERRLDKNRKRRLTKHLRNHGNDRSAVHAFANIKGV